MYAYISGKLVDIAEGVVVIDNNGIGYEICVSNTTLAQLSPMGSTVKLYIYHSVKEDDESLYGFFSTAERSMFLKLISISGLGPKMAQTILSAISVNALSMAVMTGDVKSLAKVKGIGKKTAERIVLELKESVGEDTILLSAASGGNVAQTAMDTVAADALEALESMGLARSDAYEAVMRARQTTDDVASIVRSVLKQWKQ